MLKKNPRAKNRKPKSLMHRGSNMANRCKRVLLIGVIGLLFWSAWGCSGGKPLHTTLEGNLLQYDETDMVTFNLSGEAKCDECGGDDVFVGLFVELYPKNDPTHNLSVGTFSGLGHFSFPNLRAVADSVIQIYGTLYIEGEPDSSALRAQAEFKVPNDDGETASVILHFLPD